MATTSGIIGFASSSLLNYFNARIGVSLTASSRSAATSKQSSSAGSAGMPPWASGKTQSLEALAAAAMSTTDLFPANAAPLASIGADAKTEQDNQNLFSLYRAISSLSTLASLAKTDGATPGQLAGYNTRFQAGLQQVESFLKNTAFNNFTLQNTTPGSSITSPVSVPYAPMQYTGGTIVTGDDVSNALPNITASESFTIAVKKGGTTTNVNIGLSNVQGPLTLDNVVKYVNQQLSAAGFSTRFSKVMTSGSIDDPENATWGIAISDVPSETVTLSSAQATPSLYIAGNTGSPSSSGTGAEAANPDEMGRLVKLVNISSSPSGEFNATVASDSGNTTAQATAVDSNGNVFVIGNSTGSFGTQLNLGSQDVYLTKYDSAGNVQWTRLLGSATTANGCSLAIDAAGGVVVAGSTTSDLSQTAIADGNTDSFVAKYDSDGNQQWVQQIQTLNNNQANAVTVDANGHVYIGGQTTGTIGAGQTNSGGSDSYVAAFDSAGNRIYQQQFGTSGADQVSAMATEPDGSLLVASTQNGHAILAKYADGDATATPVWQQDLGALQNGGSIAGITVSGNKIYISGTSSGLTGTPTGTNAVNSPSGNSDAFLFGLTDNGSSVAAGTLTYIGTSAKDSGGGVTVGADGTVYLAGTTTGTFAGQSRTVSGTNNMFVSAVNPDGTVQWTRQYGGADGKSTGSGIAIDTQGSSVLDALGLPHGTIAIPQSFDLTTDTTLRAGDSFEIDVAGAAARKITITIDPGETLQSLATKISADMAFIGKAQVTYANGGEALEISVNAGVTATLASGPSGFDALAPLGLSPGVLTKAAGKSSTSNSASSSSTSQVFGLGLTGTLDLSTQAGAKQAYSTLQIVLSSVRNAYSMSNAPSVSERSAPGQNASGAVPAYLQSQIASYSLALNLFPGSSSSSSTSA